MTADQVRSLLLAHAVAGRIVTDPSHALALARDNLTLMSDGHRVRGGARRWLQEWATLLEGPLPELLLALTSPLRHSRELRQLSPFAGLIDDDERVAVLRTARQANRPARRRDPSGGAAS